MARIVHFEITADDPERAIRFYRQALGWKIEPMGDASVGYWLVTTGADGEMGINGAIMGRATPNQAVINTVGVANLEEAIAAVRSAGGSVGDDIDTIANVGRFTYATDTEGNLFGLLEPAQM
jgi:Predicted enzyme related to lactoylglutathione lyase